MSDPDVEWVPGNPFRERLLWSLSWCGLAYVVGASVTLGLAMNHDLTLSPALVGWFIAGTIGVCGALLLMNYLPRSRPGFLAIGISREGLSIRYPLLTRTFPWSDLIWYSDRMRVEGRSGWAGPSLLSLTTTQFQRIQRVVYPR